MEILFNVFAVLHFVGWAIVLGGYFASLRGPALARGVFHGAATALVAGIVMMGLLEGGAVDHDFDRTKLTTKLVIALVITILAFLAQRKGDKVSPALKHAVGLLTVANIVIAVFWH